jgi:hypothetical protein
MQHGRPRARPERLSGHWARRGDRRAQENVTSPPRTRGIILTRIMRLVRQAKLGTLFPVADEMRHLAGGHPRARAHLTCVLDRLTLNDCVCGE